MEFEYEEIGTVLADDPIFNDVYDSENKKETSIANGRKTRQRQESETRNDTIELIRELHEENREENRTYRNRLLTLLEAHASGLNSDK